MPPAYHSCLQEDGGSESGISFSLYRKGIDLHFVCIEVLYFIFMLDKWLGF